MRQRDHRGGFLLPQILFIVLWLSALAAIALGRASTAVQRSTVAMDALDAYRGLIFGLEVATTPPSVPDLCLSVPLRLWRQRWSLDGGRGVEVRWRHVGAAVVLAEIDATGPRGARRRVLVWLVPDSVEQTPAGMRCYGSTLRPAAGGAIFARPGE